MGEYSKVFENCYFADRHNRQFSGKFAKLLERGVKCYDNKRKRLIYFAEFNQNKHCKVLVSFSIKKIQ